jgi:type I restriction enzyme S subunit
MSGNASTPLRDVAKIVPGRHILGEDHNCDGIGVPYITGPSDFTEEVASPSRWTKSPDVICEGGDILITVKGAGVGKINFAPCEPTCIGRQIMAIRPKNKDTDVLFLYFYLLSLNSLFQKNATGATIPGLSIDQIANVPVPTFPVQIQHQIGIRLKAYFKRIRNVRENLETAWRTGEILREKNLSESFHGIIPLSVGRDESEPPEGWQWRTLTDLARLESGHTPSRRIPEYWADGDIPWLALPDIRALDCRVAAATSEKTNSLGIANSSARVLPPGTVALSRTASVGFVTRFGCEMATSQDFVNWVCGPDLQPGYLMWLLRASRRFIRGLSTGAIHQTVYTDVVKRFRVCVPNAAEQRRIATRLDEAFSVITRLQSAHQDQLAALDRLRAAFLREAFERSNHLE